MQGMCKSAYDNLVAGGRFVAYGINPAFTLSKPDSTKYGFTVLRQVPEAERYVCDAEFMTEPPTPVRYFQWGQATYEWALTEVGFRDVTTPAHPLRSRLTAKLVYITCRVTS
jgi:hypothetical protein